MSYGANVNTKDIHGYSLMTQAINAKNYALIKLLLNNGAQVNSSDLICTIRTKRYRISKLLIESLEENDPVVLGLTSLGPSSGRLTPLLQLIANFDHRDIDDMSQTHELVKLLLKKGADMNYRPHANQSIFYFFVHQREDADECETFRALFETILNAPSCDVNCEDMGVNMSPLTLSIFTMNFKLAEALLLHGADCNRIDWSDAMFSCRAVRLFKLMFYFDFRFSDELLQQLEPGPTTLFRPGDEFHHHFTAYRELYQWITVKQSSCPSLKEMCRRCLWKTGGRHLVEGSVNEYNLPKVLADYVLFKEL